MKSYLKEDLSRLEQEVPPVSQFNLLPFRKILIVFL